MTAAPAYDNSVRTGYARVSTRAQEHQAQLDALAAAHCREIAVETASTRGDRPRLREALGRLRAGDTLVIYKPDRVARSMKELLVLLEDQLHARGINLHILTGIGAGIHRPDGATIADKMLFMVAAMAAEMERDLIRERTLDGLRAAEAGPCAAHAGDVRRPRAPPGRCRRRAEGWPVPSYSTVYAIIRGIDPALRTLAVKGAKRYAEVFELVYRRQAARPNEIWQADHTQLDLWVVTPAGQPARPWLTVIEDDRSRAIAG